MTYFVCSTYKTTAGDVANLTVTRKSTLNSAVAEFHSKMSSLISEATTVMASACVLDECMNKVKEEVWNKE